MLARDVVDQVRIGHTIARFEEAKVFVVEILFGNCLRIPVRAPGRPVSAVQEVDVDGVPARLRAEILKRADVRPRLRDFVRVVVG